VEDGDTQLVPAQTERTVTRDKSFDGRHYHQPSFSRLSKYGICRHAQFTRQGPVTGPAAARFAAKVYEILHHRHCTNPFRFLNRANLVTGLLRRRLMIPAEIRADSRLPLRIHFPVDCQVIFHHGARAVQSDILSLLYASK